MLAAGTRLGPYTIASAIELRGVGELYHARDEQEHRDVAIRVLRADFGGTPDRLRRFQQEVEPALGLRHPAILTLYTVGTDAGAAYVVSEPLAGETLRLVLSGGRLPVRTAVEYAVQIAHGLAAAHQQGLVHRDLKPENILLLPGGRVKILGFGVATLTQIESALTGLKGLGGQLGTPAYMSPEQARGLPADARSDVFAFGAILYEMLSGARAFSGATPLDTITAVLKSDPPPLTPSDEDVSPALARIADRCLRKNPASRVSAADAATALDQLWAQSAAAAPVAAAARPRRRLARLVAIVAAVALAAAVVPAAIRYVRTMRSAGATAQTAVAPLDSVTSLRAPDRPVAHFALSRDGRVLAFTTADGAGPQRLRVRSLTDGTERELANTDGASFPFWSPDGRFIAFFAEGTLKKIEAAGGSPVVLADAEAMSPGAWTPGDLILFQRDPNGPLHGIPADGGDGSPVTAVMSGETGHAWPALLPDGRRFLYVARGAEGDMSRVYAGSVESMTRTPVLANASRPAYAGGHLFFLRDALMAQPFDPETLKLGGEAVRIGNAASAGSALVASFGVSEAGTLAMQAMPQSEEGHSQLVWFDRDGKEVGRLGESADYADLRWSPDGTRLAVSIRERGANAGDLWLIDVAQGTRTAFTSDAADDRAPVWSPDSRRIAFASARKGSYDVYQKPVSGAGREAVVLEASGDQIASDWSRDGRYLLFETNQPSVAAGGNADLWARPVPNGRPFAFLRTVHPANQGTFSPDGRRVAYTSLENGREDVYVARFPRPDGRQRISSRGGAWPRWRRDGNEVFYLAPDKRLMAVPVKSGSSTIDAGAARPLFQAQPRPDRGAPYEVSADGQRFLINTMGARAGGSGTRQHVALIDWRTTVPRTDQ